MARRKSGTSADNTLPENLRIGGVYNEGRIKEIHELCIERPSPHLHLLTEDGPRCLSFSTSYTTYKGPKKPREQILREFREAAETLARVAKNFPRVGDKVGVKV